MTRDLILIIFAFILIIYFIIKIYASCKIQRLYEDYRKYEMRYAYGKCSNVSLLNRYLDIVFFRNKFYIFLSNYLKNTRFENRHIYIEHIFPEISKDIDKKYLRDFL